MAFFKLRDALNDVKYSYGFKDVSVAALKLVGKTAVNTVQIVGKAAVETAIKSAERDSGKMLGNPNLTDEQRSKLESVNQKSKEWVKNNEIKKNEEEKKREEDERGAKKGRA